MGPVAIDVAYANVCDAFAEEVLAMPGTGDPLAHGFFWGEDVVIDGAVGNVGPVDILAHRLGTIPRGFGAFDKVVRLAGLSVTDVAVLGHRSGMPSSGMLQLRMVTHGLQATTRTLAVGEFDGAALIC